MSWAGATRRNAGSGLGTVNGVWCFSMCPRDEMSSANSCAATCVNQHFGCLQASVWITPDPPTEERPILGDGKIDVESLLLLEGRPCAGESDAEIVAGAWDFETINRRYARHLRVLDQRPGGAMRNDATAKALLRWAAEERKAWLEAVTCDPLLPSRILPSEYLGPRAWRRRVEVLRDANRQMRTFRAL